VSADPLPFESLLPEGDPKACCASVYDAEPVRWLFGEQLHPGGDALTRRLAQLAGVERSTRVLDVASGTGATAHLLARELGGEVVGLELGSGAVARARGKGGQVEAGPTGAVEFVEGDAEAMPFEPREFDVVICECSLCTFPDKTAAASEMARVLRGRGRVALADVTAEHDRLPPSLRGAAARVACVADALPAGGYERLLEEAGLTVTAVESHDDALLRMIDRVEARLRVARMLPVPALAPFRDDIVAALELVRPARRAVEHGALGYAVVVASLP
jgi:arsenite methyltransferase